MSVANDKCGIAAINIDGDLGKHPLGASAHYLIQMLIQQQHRGQLSAGISTYNPERRQVLDTRCGLGTVQQAFRLGHESKRNSILRHFSGSRGIGHVRYATSGLDEPGYIQPFERSHGRVWKWFSFAFNGNLANYAELKDKLTGSNYHLIREVDTEVIMHFLAKQFLGESRVDVRDVFSNVSAIFDGAYNIAYMNAEGTLAVVRDPIGFRPLSYFSQPGMCAAASESCAFTNLTENSFKAIPPGHMLIVENNSVEVKRFAKSSRTAHCMFEWVYFANPSSVIDGRSVYESRWALGKKLADVEPLEVNSGDYVVGAVPDTATPAAHALSHELGLPTMEALIRNRYVGRTFIEGKERAERVKDKYTVNKAVVKGKKLILVDDSIVRGTTSRALVDYMRKRGKPKEIHMRVTCPPIKCPCFYGIDMSTQTELIAPRHMAKDELEATGVDASEKAIESIRREIGADTLVYNSIESMVRSINLEGGSRNLCMACLTGEYPTPCGRKLFEKAKRNFRKKGAKAGATAKRTYA